MAKEKVQRTKYLRIMEILKQDSDEDRPLTTSELIEKLKKYGIKIDRRTLYEDIEVLNDLGYEVFTRRGKSNCYYVCDRQFDVPELRILMDAVQAASFITAKKSAELNEKIAALGGSYRAELLKRNIVGLDAKKHSNESIFYNISTLEDAINNRHKASFFYFDLNENGERIYRNDKTRYEISPLGTVFSNENYYLAAYHKKYKKVVFFRIDRMSNVDELDKKIDDNPVIDGFLANPNSSKAFEMFTGETQNVTLEFDKKLIDIIFDKFGENAKLEKFDDKYRVSVDVQISPLFFGWCCSFGQDLRIVAPNLVLEQLKAHLNGILKNYL